MFDPLTPILVFLVTAGVKEFLSKVFNKELDAATSAFLATVIAAAIVLANQFALAIPAQYVPIVGALVGLIVTIASAFGVHATVKFFSK